LKAEQLIGKVMLLNSDIIHRNDELGLRSSFTHLFPYSMIGEKYQSMEYCELLAEDDLAMDLIANDECFTVENIG
jgi:hypothetical protein